MEEAGGIETVPPLVKFRADFSRIFQHYLDRSAPLPLQRWLGTLVVALIYVWRIYSVQGFYVVSYGLGIYVLNLLIGFLSPKVDPEVEALESLDGALPTKTSDEFRPFVRRLPEFKFWVRHHQGFYNCFHHDTVLCAGCARFLANTLDLLGSSLCSHYEETNSAYDQVQVCTFRLGKEEVQGEQAF
ncbi:unnamed protein product [Linum tenue]|uniref:Uncharacterized protein n=1 Tax=Linum tenue TaxID=586396 RepID=A0AAV0NTV3_9ROSI|nr:unnamed protein product [Linum tenue]